MTLEEKKIRKQVKLAKKETAKLEMAGKKRLEKDIKKTKALAKKA